MHIRLCRKSVRSGAEDFGTYKYKSALYSMYMFAKDKLKERSLLSAIFLVILAAKLYFAFQAQGFDADAYFEQRQIESILKTGFPISWDEFSFSGRYVITSPVHHYLMTFFSLIFSINVAMKLIPNLIISLLALIIYLIIKKITDNPLAALICALFTGFVPVIVPLTSLTASSYPLAFSLMFLALYYFISSHEKKHMNYFIITVLIMPFVHPITIIILLGLVIYFVMMRLDGLQLNVNEIEAALFALFFMTLVLFLQYKDAFIMNGAAIVWQNIPMSLLNDYFAGVSILNYIAAIGIIPLVFGIYTLYKYLFTANKSSMHIFIGFTLSLFLLLWLKILGPEIGLALISLNLIILTGEGVKLFIQYLGQTKFGYWQTLILAAVLVLFIFTSVNDTISAQNESIKDIPDQDILLALEWLKYYTPAQSVVLSTLENGHLITGMANRKNVYDNNFILIKNPDRIIEETNKIFTSNSIIESIKLLNKYKVNYLLLHVKGQPKLITDENCFKKMYSSKKYNIYQSLCKVEEIA